MTNRTYKEITNGLLTMQAGLGVRPGVRIRAHTEHPEPRRYEDSSRERWVALLLVDFPKTSSLLSSLKSIHIRFFKNISDLNN